MRGLKRSSKINIIVATLALCCWFASSAVAQQDQANALNKQAVELSQAGKYAEAIPLAERALALYERSNHPNVATALNFLATLYESQGRYADAEPLFQKSLAILEKGSNHLSVAALLNNLATLYSKQGRYGDAEPLVKRALTVNEKMLGRDHREVAVSLTILIKPPPERIEFSFGRPVA